MKATSKTSAERKKASKIIKAQLNAEPESKQEQRAVIDNILKEAPKQDFYTEVEPMLATLVNQAFDSDEWIYEVKWDGYRAAAFIDGKTVLLKSRNNKSFSEKFYPIQQALEQMKLRAVLDGEVVVLGQQGRADFGSLQNWRSEADGDLVYYVFDILWYEGKDLKQLPLIERRAILTQILPVSNSILVSEAFHESGIEFLEAAKNMGLEGIMAKRKDSLYHTKNRTKNWLKIKANKRQEVVIGGFTLNEDSNKLFSSLLVGVYDGRKLIYTGKVGTGFNAKMQREMMAEFKPLISNQVPFTEEPDVNKGSRFRPNPPHATVTWLKPTLIGEVSYTELTNDGVMRHPSFEGMRFDKKAESVVLEQESITTNIIKDSKLVNERAESKRKTLLNPNEKSQVKKVNRHELKFTNLDKIFWPDEKIRKRDLINYYYQAAPFILPYLKGRPQSMNRFPNGILEDSFYYKNITGKAPDWIQRYAYTSDTDHEKKQYLVGSDEATLLYMANLACVEMNPWNSTIKKPDHPTYCIIDLDPDKNTFDQVVETALVTKDVLDSMGVPSYCKTSGSTGLHIYIPLGNKYTYEQSREFARIIVKLINKELPGITSIERQISDRKGKMYLDFLQNRPHATVASVYSVRPKPGATVSMPLEWDEVKKGLKISDFNIFNAMERMESLGDIFKPVLGKGIDMLKVISRYEKENEN